MSGALAAAETRCAAQVLGVQLALRSANQDFIWQATWEGDVGWCCAREKGFANVWWERSVEELEATCHQHDPRPWLPRVVGFPDFGRCADVWQRPELVLLGGHVWPGSLAQLLFDAPGRNHGRRNMGIEGQGNFTGAWGSMVLPCFAHFWPLDFWLQKTFIKTAFFVSGASVDHLHLCRSGGGLNLAAAPRS